MVMEEFLLDTINEIRSLKGAEKIDHLSPEMNLRDDLGLSSFDLAELTVKIEDEYDIDIFEDGLVNTIGEILSKFAE